MSRSRPRASRGLWAALVTSILALVWLAPAVTWAGTPYTVHWLITEENPVCETADLRAHDGEPYFSVNQTPLPTYQIPGAFRTNGDGTESNTADAGFDSVLLFIGSNGFHFQIFNEAGNDTCVHQHDVVSVVSPTLGLNKPLFNVRRDGTAFSGNASVDLSLAEINPPLARDIANLEATIAAERQVLIDNAAKTADLAAKLGALQQLDTELHQLVSRPLDEIERTDLDEILDRYKAVVDGATRAAVDQLVTDLEKSVTDLEDELASLIDNFGAQADAVADLATKSARAAGFKPDDPSSYALGAWNVPSVDIPDISSVPGAFNPGNDPYDAYAEKVIAALAQDVSGAVVTNRSGFVANVRAWRANEAALEKALRMRAGVSHAETNAFLNGQNKVTGHVRQFMDASDWFTKTPVPADLRAYVDGVLDHAFGDLAGEMKDALNQWDGDTIDLTQTQLVQTIDAFAAAMSTIGDGAAAYGDVMKTLVHVTTRVGIGFVPYAGPALDLCEAITGKSWCLPGGDELSTEQRIFSGAGVAVGAVGHFWGGTKNAAIGATAKVVAEDVSQLGEELAVALRASRRTWYKTLRGAVTSKDIDDFEKQAALYLMKNEGRAMIGVGDDGVRKVLGIPKTAPFGSNAAKAPDFVSVTKGNKLALSEAKDGTHVNEALTQLKNATDKLKEMGLAEDVERVEIIRKRGRSLGDPDLKVVNGYLVRRSTGERVTLKGFKNLVMVIEL